MAEKMTKQRVAELLDEIKKYEGVLKTADEVDGTAQAWATLTIAKAKLTALQGEFK
jgi:hypothetical protein